ncbi:group II intron reverse transcriptase/maturase [Lysinibacillus composti]|uniref:Reverse transcriptase domain-containing protein n=1 Tax=Lysinibacillus composti TaxID=720633 RepID=A0A3N9UJQ7_9BACI|nr:reverse transcriptase domain-containing protein [Lysinibacillus composti]MBM7607268.1 group II intron reverse transcriptase/maturase [Lysinibacillus composti]RQW76155.1 hypothetical protein EBB45_00990 [Lysinibacillus composti]
MTNRLVLVNDARPNQSNFRIDVRRRSPIFNATERIAYLSKIAKSNKEIKFKKLFPILLKEEFLELAYAKIANNKGSMTAGVDGVNKNQLEDKETRSNFLKDVIEEIAKETYQPLPVRRVEIPKRNSNKKRPLGIPTFKDRIIQSAIKIILEAIYEPIFSVSSHGFRPRRSCQTAIHTIICRKYDWVVEGDIKGCFDNIEHSKLINILRQRIADEKFINLINKFLKSGYQMGYGIDGKNPIYYTEQGTPQGGIVSPILANIFLHEFDKYMETHLCNMKEAKASKEYTFYRNKIARLSRAISDNKTPYHMTLEPMDENDGINFIVNSKEEAMNKVEEIRIARKATEYQSKEYKRMSNRINALKRHIEQNKPFPYQSAKNGEERVRFNTREEMISKLLEYKKKAKHVPRYDKEDYFNNKSVGYVRYADDFVILLGNHTKKEAKKVKEVITEWFGKELSLSLSEEKTLITHSTKGFRFLGYDIVNIPKQDGIGYRNFSKVYVPRDRIKELTEKLDNLLILHYEYPLFDLITRLNRVISGWSNYYKICNNWSSVSSKLDHRLSWKIIHWVGRKHKCKITKVYENHVVKTEAYGATYKQRIVDTIGEKTVVLRKFFDYKFTTTKELNNKIRNLSNGETEEYNVALELDYLLQETAKVKRGYSPREFYKIAEENGYQCSHCGNSTNDLIVHHTRLVKRHSRKDSKAIAESTQQVPKILLCVECHKKVHPNSKAIKTLAKG